MNKYNVTYVYISPRMYKSQEPDYGLGESVSYDTHFKTEFANGESAIYKYIKNPALKPPNSENITVLGTYSKTVDFIEKFWNGYSYSEFGKGYMDQNNLDYEDYGYYKGNYNLNAQIIYLYNYIYGKTGDGNLKNRTDYLTRWLQYKQMDDGAFISLNPPAVYTVGSMEVLYPLMKTDYNNTEKNGIIKKGTSFIDAQVSDSGINVSNKQTKDLLEGDYSESKTDALVSGMYPAGKEKIVYNLIAKQGADGSWYWESYKNIAILKGLSLYYKETNDKKVKESIIKGANWLKANQNSDGKFKDDKEDLKPYNLKQYAEAFYIYETVGEKEYADRTLQYIKTQKINDDITPLTSYLSLLFNLSDFFGMEESLNIINKLL